MVVRVHGSEGLALGTIGREDGVTLLRMQERMWGQQGGRMLVVQQTAQDEVVVVVVVVMMVQMAVVPIACCTLLVPNPPPLARTQPCSVHLQVGLVQEWVCRGRE